MIVPYGEVVRNRIMLEIFRGCTRGLPLLSGRHDLPSRARALTGPPDRAFQLVKATGYDEISLMSLSSGDYSRITDLAREMTLRFQDRRVKVSLPSLRIDSVLKDALAKPRKCAKPR